MHFYLGIDVSKAKLDCALRLSNGKYRNKVIDNNPVVLKIYKRGYTNTKFNQSMQSMSAWKQPTSIGKRLLCIWPILV